MQSLEQPPVRALGTRVPSNGEEIMSDLIALIKRRQSARVPFDQDKPVPESHLETILEAASWAPTAHNMQNYDIVVVDDTPLLNRIGAIRSGLSESFIRENYHQLSFSEEELKRKKTGVLAAMFPPSWRDPKLFSKLEDVAFAEGPSFMSDTIRHSPTLLFVLYDARKRAPASEGDVLGFISLGCVMQNMWLAAESLGVGFQIMSAFSNERVEGEVRTILKFPDHAKIAFAARLGYPRPESRRILETYLRVRRDVGDFAYRNAYGIPFRTSRAR